LGLRARGQLQVVVHDGYGVSHCRAVDVSPAGLLLDRGREVTGEDMRRLLRLQLLLPGQRLIRATGRPVRSDGRLQGVQLVAISDVDRLGLCEFIDGLWRADPSAVH